VEFTAKSPTRIDLSGGTLDLWPIYSFLGSAVTINLAISIYTSAKLTLRSDAKIRIHLTDLNFDKTFENLSEVLNCNLQELRLVKSQLQFWSPKTGFELVTQSESPVGGGLGGSSSLTISILKVFHQWLTPEVTRNPLDLARLAHNIEAQVLRVPTGQQDYLPAILGGLNAICFGMDQTEIKPLNLDLDDLFDHMVVVYTGKPHQSGLNNWKIFKDLVDGDQHSLHCLERLREVSNLLYADLAKGDWSRISEHFNEEFQARVSLSSVFTSPEIERLRKLAFSAGGQALKICGAGGGGCCFIWTDIKNKEKVIEACQNAGFQVLRNARPVLPQKR
jgi:D-glycero-alpha-D-manno-heptose-7-phosphate kinase